jgi:iron(II)-dependent oxidoreductase
MASDLITPAGSARLSWATRVFRKLGGRRVHNADATDLRSRNLRIDPAASKKIHGMAQRLIAEDRYAFVLLKEAVEDIDERETDSAWTALDDQMALIPEGAVHVACPDGATEAAGLSAFLLDRCAVTNQQFQRFVDSGGYDNLEMWPQEVWPSLMRFTDGTGHAGPKGWEGGHFPAGKADHPVVGVCWYEALAYARWVGKRLLNAAEWQKAGGWPEHISGGANNRYPWGDIFEPTRANLWATGLGHTVPVREFAKGATPNGVYQLTGNVWEWLDDSLDTIPCRSDESFQVWKPLRRIVGGAFNTYFAAEATCQFVTGQPELDRCENIGFRCALSAERLRDKP